MPCFHLIGVPSKVQSCDPMKCCRWKSQSISSGTDISWILLKEISHCINVFLKSSCSPPSRVSSVTIEAGPCSLVLGHISQYRASGWRITVRKSCSKCVLHYPWILGASILSHHKYSLLCSQLRHLGHWWQLLSILLHVHNCCRASAYEKQITAINIQSRYYVMSHLSEHSKKEMENWKGFMLVTLTETWSQVYFVPLSKKVWLLSHPWPCMNK